MIRTSLTGRYDNGASGAVASATLNAGDFELKGKTTFINGPSFEDLSLLVEKPGSFVIDYNVPKKVNCLEFKLQFV